MASSVQSASTCTSASRATETTPSESRTAAAAPRYAPPRPELDFFSESFDAALALRTPDLPVPFPKALPKDSIAQCACFLQPDDELYRPPPPPKPTLSSADNPSTRHPSKQIPTPHSGQTSSSLASSSSSSSPPPTTTLTSSLESNVSTTSASSASTPAIPSAGASLGPSSGPSTDRLRDRFTVPEVAGALIRQHQQYQQQQLSRTLHQHKTLYAQEQSLASGSPFGAAGTAAASAAMAGALLEALGKATRVWIALRGAAPAYPATETHAPSGYTTGTRAVLSGVVEAVDKHLNVVLSNVHERAWEMVPVKPSPTTLTAMATAAATTTAAVATSSLPPPPQQSSRSMPFSSSPSASLSLATDPFDPLALIMGTGRTSSPSPPSSFHAAGVAPLSADSPTATASHAAHSLAVPPSVKRPRTLEETDAFSFPSSSRTDGEGGREEEDALKEQMTGSQARLSFSGPPARSGTSSSSTSESRFRERLRQRKMMEEEDVYATDDVDVLVTNALFEAATKGRTYGEREQQQRGASGELAQEASQSDAFRREDDELGGEVKQQRARNDEGSPAPIRVLEARLGPRGEAEAGGWPGANCVWRVRRRMMRSGLVRGHTIVDVSLTSLDGEVDDSPRKASAGGGNGDVDGDASDGMPRS